MAGQAVRTLGSWELRLCPSATTYMQVVGDGVEDARLAPPQPVHWIPGALRGGGVAGGCLVSAKRVGGVAQARLPMRGHFPQVMWVAMAVPWVGVSA